MQKLHREIRRNYFDLLKDPRWYEYRIRAIGHHGNGCYLCAETRNIQVHHLRYIDGMNPWDYDFNDVRVYCDNCHEVVTRAADDVWNECLGMLPHEIELWLKRIKRSKETGVMHLEKLDYMLKT